MTPPRTGSDAASSRHRRKVVRLKHLQPSAVGLWLVTRDPLRLVAGQHPRRRPLPVQVTAGAGIFRVVVCRSTNISLCSVTGRALRLARRRSWAAAVGASRRRRRCKLQQIPFGRGAVALGCADRGAVDSCGGKGGCARCRTRAAASWGRGQSRWCRLCGSRGRLWLLRRRQSGKTSKGPESS